MEIKSISRLTEEINQGINSIYAYGIIDEAIGHLVYSLNKKLDRPIFVVLENDKKARDLYENLKHNKVSVFYYPELTTNFQLIEDLDFTNRALRMQTLLNLSNEENKIYISSIQAINRKIFSKKIFNEKKIEINLQSEIVLEDFIQNLIDLGYTRRNIIETKGEFAVRGDIIDIFQVHQDNPIRIELFDIEVDSIREFDINSQMSKRNLENVQIIPISENEYKSLDINQIKNRIREDLDEFKDKLDRKIFEKLQLKFEKLIEQIEYNSKVDNIDLLIPYINDNSSIFDYIPKNGLVLFEDIYNLISISKKRELFITNDIQSRISNGELLSSHHEIFFNFNDLLNNVNIQKLNISRLLKSVGDFKIDKIEEIKIRENQDYHGNIKDFLSDLKYNLKKGYVTNIFINNKDDALNFHKLLEEEEISSKLMDNLEQKEIFKVNIYPSYLEKGFDYFYDKVNFISYNQIFKKVHKRKSKTVKNKEIINYVDLEKGDLLVHDNYGIGIYLGLRNIELNGVKSDFLEIEYDKGDKLFIPTHDMAMVSKFIGNEDKKPKVSNLNGEQWKKSKSKAKRAIEEIAEDLVQLYAKRTQIQGFRYMPDTPWQKEFEEQFPYVETDAQLRAVEEIKEDMQSEKVMDRLLSGDVGYGKTEVALRAAFKAIMDSKQVVMLAPTTILVKQHFNTMKSRFANFPIKIDYLSRFKTPAQKKETLKKLKSGELDFVVGTHALLADKVSFKNLGLLIIDEEQRFGVKHKEKIKKMSESIDVLTLSATPIPRTLQMSLSGLRDMSILDEYPENRLPVNTYVMEYDEVYIREAILKEMARNGQVYFVYNRVQSINRMYEKLQELVPEAKIAVSHGQMSTRELENILEDFSNKVYDILLSTTIIETGMDIQNVNTIIIYNADMMGLSQLYQLKGRVGRSDRNAYAYFTYANGKVLTDIAEKRLKAIKDFSELGSGYKIAMRDLELRGAGNLLGESQSGHIESIGYDLYVRMLKEKIDEIKGIRPQKSAVDVKVDVKLDVYIPDSYIEDENEKINIYKKISYIEDKKDHENMIDELTDRFGDIPIQVQNILDLAYIKAMMTKNNFDSLVELETEVILGYTDLVTFDFDKLKILSKEFKYDMNFNMIGNPKIILNNQNRYTFKLIELLELITKINKENK